MPAAEMADLLSGGEADPLLLSVHRRNDLDAPELLHAGSDSRTPTLGAARRVFAERLPIGGGNRSLGRQDACRRAPCYSFGSDELGHLGCRILAGNKVPRAPVNH